LSDQCSRPQPKGEVLDEMLSCVVQPMGVVDDHELRCATPHLLVRLDDAPSKIVGDVSTFWHHDDPSGGTTVFRLSCEPLDERRLAHARWTIDDDDNGLTVDRPGQPSRQLGALRDSPDDVDHHD
jgi:hypothetical protein